jgi:hypothetical protein
MSVFKRESFAEFQARVVELNKLYGEDSVHADLISGKDNDEETVAAISAAPHDAVLARKKLMTIHKDFPYGSNSADQAAFLLRAFAGLAPFSKGNFETGWDYTAELFHHAGINWNLDTDATELSLQITDRLSSYQGGFQRRHCLERDEMFAWLSAWCQIQIE